MSREETWSNNHERAGKVICVCTDFHGEQVASPLQAAGRVAENWKTFSSLYDDRMEDLYHERDSY